MFAAGPKSTRLRSRWLDLGLTGLIAGLDIATQWDMAETRGLIFDVRLPTWVGALFVAGYFPLIWRRRAPYLVFGLVWLQSVLCHLLVPGYRPTFGVLVALFTVATAYGTRLALVSLAGALAVSALSLLAEYRLSSEAGDADTLVAGFLLFLLLDLAVWGAGRTVAASRRERLYLEGERERAAQDAIREERLRLALDLHDVVAHSVTLVVLQAATARRLLGSEESRQVGSVLADIEDTGAQTMRELRALLGLINDTAVTPIPALGGVEIHADGGDSSVADLVGRMRRAGLQINVRTSGRRGTLSPAVELVAHRILQEGLTNVVKHGGVGTSVTIHLNWDSRTLTLRIDDDGAGRVDPAVQHLSGGRGLKGLRGRTAAVGGTLTTNPTTNGFQLTATLPTVPS